MLVTKEFTFDSAHFLPSYNGKCEDMHGHTYKLHVTVDGQIDNEGIVIDFAILKKITNNKVLSKLDHKLINDTIEVASCENIAVWIWNKLVDSSVFHDGVKLNEIKLWETPTSFVTYNGK